MGNLAGLEVIPYRVSCRPEQALGHFFGEKDLPETVFDRFQGEATTDKDFIPEVIKPCLLRIRSLPSALSWEIQISGGETEALGGKSPGRSCGVTRRAPNDCGNAWVRTENAQGAFPANPPGAGISPGRSMGSPSFPGSCWASPWNTRGRARLPPEMKETRGGEGKKGSATSTGANSTERSGGFRGGAVRGFREGRGHSGQDAAVPVAGGRTRGHAVCHILCRQVPPARLNLTLGPGARPGSQAGLA